MTTSKIAKMSGTKIPRTKQPTMKQATIKQSLIFVTVGNGRFDPLVQLIDNLKAQGHIPEEVIIQVGHGSFKPEHCRWFDFEPSLDAYYERADLIISHGGPGIVFEVLRRGKKLIAVPNRDRTDPRHQVEYLQAMAKETSALIYCDNVKMLQECLEKARRQSFEKYHPPPCKIADEITAYLNKNQKNHKDQS